MVELDNNQPYQNPSYCSSRDWPRYVIEDAENGDVQAHLYLAAQPFDFMGQRKSPLYRYEKAVAQEGTPEAMKQLVALYIRGCGGTRQDIGKACFWMEAYLNLDSPEREPCIIQLFLYTYGRLLLGSRAHCISSEAPPDLPIEMQDAEKGCKLLERAGNEYNCRRSIKILGVDLYLDEIYPKVSQDIEKAMHWLKKGAHLGDGRGAFKLAMLFHMGPAMPVNRALEKVWFRIAEILGIDHEKNVLYSLRNTPDPTQEDARKRLRHLAKERRIIKYLSTDRTKSCSNPKCNNIETENQKFSTCYKCKQVKYCGKECQVVHWKEGGHKQECSRMEMETERLKRANRNIVLPFANICYNPACSKPQPEGTVFPGCSKCKAAKYCSKQCQVVHFRNGHKKVCKISCTYLEEGKKLLEDIETNET